MVHLIFLLLAIAALAAVVVNATTSTLYRRLDKFTSLQSHCVKQYKQQQLAEQEEFLSQCGFLLVNTTLTADAMRETMDFIFNSLPIDTALTATTGDGYLQVETVHSTRLAQLISSPQLALPLGLPVNATIVRANLRASASEYLGHWFHQDFLYPQRVLRRRGLSFYDIGFPVRYDVHLPLFDSKAAASEGWPLQLCAASHYVAGVTKEECELLVDAEKKRICQLLAVASNTRGEEEEKSGVACPASALVKFKQMQLGQALIVDSRLLRRNVGSDYDPRRIRADIQAQYYVAEWWKKGSSSINEETCEVSPDFSFSPKLSFANVDIGSEMDDVVDLYRGNYELVARELRPGRNVTIRTVPGVYTLRVNGNVRKAWDVQSQSISAIFYAKQERDAYAN